MYSICMPTVLEYRGIKFKIHAKDHNPPHIHIEGRGGEMRVNLNTAEIMSSSGFSPSDERTIIALLWTYREQFMETWNELHK
jgi:hypothetical protein